MENFSTQTTAVIYESIPFCCRQTLLLLLIDTNPIEPGMRLKSEFNEFIDVTK